MNPLELIRLPKLMELSAGDPELTIAMIDGTVQADHPNLGSARIRQLKASIPGAQLDPPGSEHGTLVAQILCGQRDGPLPSVCPECTLLVRPVFFSESQEAISTPRASASQLADAMVDCIEAGARILNLSLGLTQATAQDEKHIGEALNYAAGKGVLVVAAAGNEGTIGSTPITRHPWVIPVTACDAYGVPAAYSNLGSSIGRNGFSAPGEVVQPSSEERFTRTYRGTSVATPFISGAIALLWSIFPRTLGVNLRHALIGSCSKRNTTIAPPLLDSWASYLAVAQRIEKEA